MATGRDRKLVGQVGEFLACAELGRRGFIATPFAGNVPGFDVIVVNEDHRSIVLQIKSAQLTRDDLYAWPLNRDKYLCVEQDGEIQRVLTTRPLLDERLLYIFVLVAGFGREKALPTDIHRFFICSERDVQDAARRCYSEYLNKHDGRRPRNPLSNECRIRPCDLKEFEDQWNRLDSHMAAQVPK